MLFLQRMYGHFPGTKKTVRITEVSVMRGSTVTQFFPTTSGPRVEFTPRDGTVARNEFN